MYVPIYWVTHTKNTERERERETEREREREGGREGGREESENKPASRFLSYLACSTLGS